MTQLVLAAGGDDDVRWIAMSVTSLVIGVSLTVYRRWKKSQGKHPPARPVDPEEIIARARRRMGEER